MRPLILPPRGVNCPRVFYSPLLPTLAVALGLFSSADPRGIAFLTRYSHYISVSHYTKVSFTVSHTDWEIVSNSDPMVAAALFHERDVRWITLPGAAVRASVRGHECFVVGKPPYGPSRSPSLWVRDPECFIAGEIHRHLYFWNKLTQGLHNRDEIMGWIHKKVSLFDFVHSLKGQFGGCTNDSSFPLPRLFHNHNSCKLFSELISKTIMNRISVGDVGVHGRVGQCAPHQL